MNEDTNAPEEPILEEPGIVGSDSDAEEGDVQIPDDAFFSPDDPIVRAEGDIPDDAIFSPDGPITQEEMGEGVVTGIGGSEDREARMVGSLAYELHQAASIMETLARALKEQGVDALRVTPETQPVEAVLKSFLAGYFVGRTDEVE